VRARVNRACPCQPLSLPFSLSLFLSVSLCLPLSLCPCPCRSLSLSVSVSVPLFLRAPHQQGQCSRHEQGNKVSVQDRQHQRRAPPEPAHTSFFHFILVSFIVHTSFFHLVSRFLRPQSGGVRHQTDAHRSDLRVEAFDIGIACRQRLRQLILRGCDHLFRVWGLGSSSFEVAITCLPSPTLSPTDPGPRGLLTLCPGASSGPQGQ